MRASSEYDSAVMNARISAKTMPGHMSRAVEAVPPGTVWAAWTWSVIHRNAPGAINAMAFTVTPVRPSVGRSPVLLAEVSAATSYDSFSQRGVHRLEGELLLFPRHPYRRTG